MLGSMLHIPLLRVAATVFMLQYKSRESKTWTEAVINLFSKNFEIYYGIASACLSFGLCVGLLQKSHFYADPPKGV